jgi:hypothetical protein
VRGASAGLNGAAGAAVRYRRTSKETAMFGRRKNAKSAAEVTLTAASSSVSVNPSVLTQLGSRPHGTTQAHKAMLASTLASPPTQSKIVLADAWRVRGNGQSAAGTMVNPMPVSGGSLEDQLDGGLSGGAPADLALMDQVKAIFDRQGWTYQERGGALITVAEDLPIIFGMDEELRIVHLFVPMVPGKGMQGYVATRPEAELSTAVYLLTATYRLPYGAFTRDHRDGEIRFESSLLVADAAPTDEQIAGLLVTAVAAIAQHAETIFGLYTGRTTLKQALADLDRSRIPEAQTA